MIPVFTTEEPVVLPLAADPALQRQDDSTDRISRYLDTSDPSELDGLDLSDVTHVTIRALSDAEMTAASREPGAMPKQGHQLALDDRSWHEFDDEEKAALDAYSAWERAWRMAYVRRGVQVFAGEHEVRAVEAIESVRPERLRHAVILELFSKIHHISTLGPVGKAPSKPESGKAKQPAELRAGSALTATDARAI